MNTISLIKSSIVGTTISAAFLFTNPYQSFAANTNLPAGPSDVVKLIQEKKVIKSSVSAAVRGKSVIISMYMQDEATDRDLKVDSILLAKAVTDRFGGVTKLRAVFYEDEDHTDYRFVDISKTVLDLFGKGSINDNEMLGLLSVGAVRPAVASTTSEEEEEELVDNDRPSSSGVGRWALEFFPLDPIEIVKNPDSYLANCKKRFEYQARVRAETDIRYERCLVWFGMVLRAAHRKAEGKRFEAEAMRILPNCKR